MDLYPFDILAIHITTDMRPLLNYKWSHASLSRPISQDRPIKSSSNNKAIVHNYFQPPFKMPLLVGQPM